MKSMGLCLADHMEIMELCLYIIGDSKSSLFFSVHSKTGKIADLV